MMAWAPHHDGPQTGGADLVDGIGVRLLRHPAVYGRLPAGVLAQPALEHVSHDDLVDCNLFEGTIEIVVFRLEVRLQPAPEYLRGKFLVLGS